MVASPQLTFLSCTLASSQWTILARRRPDPGLDPSQTPRYTLGSTTLPSQLHGTSPPNALGDKWLPQIRPNLHRLQIAPIHQIPPRSRIILITDS